MFLHKLIQNTRRDAKKKKTTIPFGSIGRFSVPTFMHVAWLLVPLQCMAKLIILVVRRAFGAA